MSGAASVLDVDGAEVRVTSADKVFFSKRGETKLDLAEYYLAPRLPETTQRTPRVSPSRAKRAD